MSGQQQPTTSAEGNAFWMQPPPNLGADGQPIWVDVRFVLMKVGAVDTAAPAPPLHEYNKR